MCALAFEIAGLESAFHLTQKQLVRAKRLFYCHKTEYADRLGLEKQTVLMQNGHQAAVASAPAARVRPVAQLVRVPR